MLSNRFDDICAGNIRPEVESFFRKIYNNLSNYEVVFDCFGYWVQPNNTDLPRAPGIFNKLKHIDLGKGEVIPLSNDELRVSSYLQEQVDLLIENTIPPVDPKTLAKLQNLS